MKPCSMSTLDAVRGQTYHHDHQSVIALPRCLPERPILAHWRILITVAVHAATDWSDSAEDTETTGHAERSEGKEPTPNRHPCCSTLFLFVSAISAVSALDPRRCHATEHDEGIARGGRVECRADHPRRRRGAGRGLRTGRLGSCAD